ncbi:MAG TPA: CHASE3 domain-containing protein, partial [Steroidobacteraceae bacterium]|nr:CHASE3 domain-containing protein [Steroidobacteraceae bacterium]
LGLVATAFLAAEVGRAKLIDSVRDIQQSQQRARLLVEVQSLITDAETGQRGYVLTGDETYLAPYEEAKREISAYMTEVQTAYGAPEQSAMHSRAAKLIELCAAKIADSDSTIALYRQGTRQAMTLVRTKIGQETMDALRGLVAEMRGRERQLVFEQTNEWLNIHTRQRVLSIVTTIANLLPIVLAGYLVTRDIRRRTTIAVSLESQIRQKTQELSELSTHLQRVSEAEKASLARELHDELGGLLVAIKMDLAQLKSKLDLSQPDIQKRWDRVQAALTSGIDLKRRVIEQLRPSLLDNMGLITAIRWQAGEICSAAGLKLEEYYPDTEPDLSGEAAIALFRIVQEALTNIAKHAHATRVIVELDIGDEELMLKIEDNGKGMAGETTAGSHGITSMRHRLLPFDGKFAVERVEPAGLRIRVSVALSRVSTFASQAP